MIIFGEDQRALVDGGELRYTDFSQEMRRDYRRATLLPPLMKYGTRQLSKADGTSRGKLVGNLTPWVSGFHNQNSLNSLGITKTETSGRCGYSNVRRHTALGNVCGVYLPESLIGI